MSQKKQRALRGTRRHRALLLGVCVAALVAHQPIAVSVRAASAGRFEGKAASARLDAYGSTAFELPSTSAAQLLGLELMMGRASVGTEISSALLGPGGFDFSLFAEGPLVDQSHAVLGERLALDVFGESRLFVHPELRLELHVDGDVAWGPLIADHTSHVDISGAEGIVGSHRLEAEVEDAELLLRGEA